MHMAYVYCYCFSIYGEFSRCFNSICTYISLYTYSMLYSSACTVHVYISLTIYKLNALNLSDIRKV